MCWYQQKKELLRFTRGYVSERKLSYTCMTKSLDALNELGYLDLVLLGERDPYSDTSFTSRYRATKTLTGLFTEYGFNQQSIIKDKTAVAGKT